MRIAETLCGPSGGTFFATIDGQAGVLIRIIFKGETLARLE
jgi:hypothetical protein